VSRICPGFVPGTSACHSGSLSRTEQGCSCAAISTTLKGERVPGGISGLGAGVGGRCRGPVSGAGVGGRCRRPVQVAPTGGPYRWPLQVARTGGPYRWPVQVAAAARWAFGPPTLPKGPGDTAVFVETLRRSAVNSLRMSQWTQVRASPHGVPTTRQTHRPWQPAVIPPGAAPGVVRRDHQTSVTSSDDRRERREPRVGDSSAMRYPL